MAAFKTIIEALESWAVAAPDKVRRWNQVLLTMANNCANNDVLLCFGIGPEMLDFFG